ncbi:MAG: hypothetical protein Ta2F_13120 [Termitinemataceae bacterium]|nr:MAG: hypothetical protein Ta2F_13120 [Termitinemataceae bacterium]
MLKNQVFLKQCKARCFTPPPPVGNRSKPTGLVLALIAAFVLFSACRSGNNAEEIIEIIDGANEPPAVPTVAITVDSDYEGAITLKYAEKPTSTSTKPISGSIADSGIVQLASYPPRGALVVSIEVGTNPPIYIGRLIGSSAISLKLKLNNSGNLELRPADSGVIIPIGTYSEFQLIRADAGTLGGSYIQEADIDLMGNAGLGVPDWEPVGTDTAPFTGNFDGDGKQIKRLYINDDTRSSVGLFGYSAGQTSLANIHIASGSVTGDYYVGGILGYNNNSDVGTISNCSNGAAITGKSRVGGVVGHIYNYKFAISDCYNSGEVKGDDTSGSGGVGGVVGDSRAEIIRCYNLGKVDSTATSSNTATGGVAGRLSSHMLACFNAGDVTSNSANNTGGLVGMFTGQGRTLLRMTASYNSGNVNGAGDCTGGLIGNMGNVIEGAGCDHKIIACYNSGNVIGPANDKTHSLVGAALIFGGTVTYTACYWKADTYTSDDTYGWPNADANAGKFTTAYFTPSTSDSAEWGTGQGTASGTYWKEGTTNGSMLPKLWYEK